MTDIHEATTMAGIERTLIFEATPPRQPAPMLRQTITFWTLRGGLAAMMVSIKELRRPMRMTQRAVVPVPNVDEPG